MQKKIVSIGKLIPGIVVFLNEGQLTCSATSVMLAADLLHFEATKMIENTSSSKVLETLEHANMPGESVQKSNSIVGIQEVLKQWMGELVDLGLHRASSAFELSMRVIDMELAEARQYGQCSVH